MCKTQHEHDSVNPEPNLQLRETVQELYLLILVFQRIFGMQDLSTCH